MLCCAVLALVSCSQPKRRIDLFGKAHPTSEDVRSFPLSRYRAFPRQVRKLMQSHDIDLSHCWDTTDVEGNTLRACNRSRRLLAALEAKGWCWGSVKHISVDDDWMRCHDIPDYSPTDPKADSALFAEADFREAARPLRGPAECLDFERDPERQVKLPLSDVFGSRVFTLDDEKYFPIAYYRSYPRPVQRLMQRDNVESNQCRGGSGNDVEILRACNRRDRITVQLERIGWCWGSIQHVGALDHWMRCSDLGLGDRDLEQSAKLIEEVTFNESYLREVYDDWKEQRDICLNKLSSTKPNTPPPIPPAPGSNQSP